MARAKKKWAKLGNPGEAHIVLTMDGCDDPIDDVVESVAAMSAFRQVLVVGSDGVIRIKK